MKQRGVFKIGHQNTQSETFKPEAARLDELKLTFLDMAGNDDTGGMLIELINNFIFKFILNTAKNVRFLFVFTHEQLSNAKGQKVREFINLLDQMSKPQLREIKDTLVPVLTKCKPGDEEVDADVIQNSVEQMLQEEFKTSTQHHYDTAKRDAILQEKQ